MPTPTLVVAEEGTVVADVEVVSFLILYEILTFEILRFFAIIANKKWIFQVDSADVVLDAEAVEDMAEIVVKEADLEVVEEVEVNTVYKNNGFCIW